MFCLNLANLVLKCKYITERFMIKVVFLGTSRFAVPSLEALTKDTQVTLVITQPDKPVGRGYNIMPTPVKIMAERLGISVVQPNDVNSDDILNMVRKIEPDFIVVVAYGQILKKPWFSIAKNEILNLHASLLPKYRGASPIESAILAGDKETGVSIMGIRAKMDAGPIYTERRVDIGDKSCGELASELSNIGAEVLCETVSHFGVYRPMKQAEKSATYCKKITRRDGRVIFDSMDALSIYKMYKAFSGWPAIYGYFREKRIIFTEIKIADVKPASVPSEMVEKAGKVYVRARDGCIEIVRVKPEGKREMSVLEFLRGVNGMPKLN